MHLIFVVCMLLIYHFYNLDINTKRDYCQSFVREYNQLKIIRLHCRDYKKSFHNPCNISIVLITCRFLISFNVCCNKPLDLIIIFLAKQNRHSLIWCFSIGTVPCLNVMINLSPILYGQFGMVRGS